MTFALSQGIYTISDTAHLVGEPIQRVRSWLKAYWQDQGYGKLAEVPSIDFRTLIELKTFVQLRIAGVTARDVNRARQELQQLTSDRHPFAKREILKGLATDGKRVNIKYRDRDFLSLDGKRQFQLGVIEDFMQHIDFDELGRARRYRPASGKGSIVLDPKMRFGAPTIAGTSIEAELICRMHESGDSISLLSSIYELSPKQVEDAIAFCMAA